MLHLRLCLCTVHKISCQQAHPATVKFLFVVAKYHILILKRWIVSFYSQLPKHMVRGQNWFLNNLYVLSFGFTWISLCQVLQNLSWKRAQAEFMLKFWRLSNASGCCEVVNRCLIFCDQLFLNIDLSHRKIVCVNWVSGILISLFHRRIISMWRRTLSVVHPMSPDTAKFGACLWTLEKCAWHDIVLCLF